MRSYELLLVTQIADEEATKAILDKATNLITNNGGAIENVDVWGKRRLAYPINDLLEGHYTIVNFKGEPGVAKELDRVLKITDGVMRFIIVRPEE